MKRVATGVLVGGAVGDAMGFPTEFNTVEQIAAKYGDWRAMELPVSQGVAYVTDDTQMALAVGEGLVEVLGRGEGLDASGVEGALRGRFVEWCYSAENNRAPGATCIRACEALGRGGEWQAASVVGSKGCGANMRVAPVGVAAGLGADERAGIAQLQAALTHGHPTALAASDLTAYAVWVLAQGVAVREVLPALRDYAERSRRGPYREDWLGDLADYAPDADRAAFVARGWDECLGVLERVADALRAPDVAADPCLATGAGWIAEEAFATGLYCFLLLPDDPPDVVRRAAYSSGDSDSIAALAGAFAGAHHGADAWPAAWVDVIEYRERLLALGDAWDGAGA